MACIKGTEAGVLKRDSAFVDCFIPREQMDQTRGDRIFVCMYENRKTMTLFLANGVKDILYSRQWQGAM
jgi:hypothetical protein